MTATGGNVGDIRMTQVGITLILSLAPPTLGADVIKPTPVEGAIKWVYSYEEGKRLARESGKPLFVVFRCER